MPTIGHISKQYSRRQRQKDTTEQEARKWLQLMVERDFIYFYVVILSDYTTIDTGLEEWEVGRTNIEKSKFQ